MIASYQKDFLEFAIETGVLQFGEFELKSGRISPYFFNAGKFNHGASLGRLGQFYAAALQHSRISYDLLFGPAYKGIPLVSATVIALYEHYDIDVPYVFNRKELKNHGEGGQLVGAELEGKVVIVDDVITAGTAIREVMQILSASTAEASAVLVAIDRQEKGSGDLSAIQEIERDYGVTVISVVTFADIVEFLQASNQFDGELELMQHYRESYGVSPL